jgi:hypothetical protein
MKRTSTRRAIRAEVALAGRLCRPQRIGVFGHRGAGKTTFLTMLYREAVAGRLGSVRLASADARTANYLADKVVQLESGEALPATLGETELRFNLYHQGARLELVLLDYQGEHVALGRHEPVRDFLRDCDAVWLCLESVVSADPSSSLSAQQEVEQVVEDYLAVRHPDVPHRPMALLVTKSDLLPAPPGDRFAMTQHALVTHCPGHALIMVSSLGASLPLVKAPFAPQPLGLDAALTWLADALRAQDEARMERLWQLAPKDLPLLTSCVEAFRARYPDAPATALYRQRLAQARSRRTRRRLLGSLAAVAALMLGLTSFDAWGASQVRHFEKQHADNPTAVRDSWLAYQRWHPLRHLGRASAAQAEQAHLADLHRQVREKQREEALTQLRREAADPDADPTQSWETLLALHASHPELADESEFQSLREQVKSRADAQQAQLQREEHERREKKAESALRELERLARSAPLEGQIERVDRFLREHDGTEAARAGQKLRLATLRSLDDRDFETAREYSAQNPLNFLTRRRHYQQYLERHPEGARATQARAAVLSIAEEWDRHDFRAVRDHFRDKPGDLKELRALCQTYLAAHPEGKFVSSARELVRWSERIEGVGEYKVVLRSGSFEHKIAATFSRGPCLSVEIEVAGVRYGPSNIVARRYDPDWSFEFPRRIRWKAGDSVRIVVTDNWYWKRKVAERSSEDEDRLALRLLSGEVEVGNGRLVFESDFSVPTLPEVD